MISMFSPAVSGSVSDATKATPSFTVTNVLLTPKNAQGGTVAPGLQTLTANQTTANIALSAVNAVGPGTLEYKITASLGNSGGGGRPTNNSHVLLPVGTLNRGKTGTENNKQITQTNFDDADVATIVGNFEPPGPDGSGGQSPRNVAILESAATGGASGAIPCEGQLLFENVEVQNAGGASAARGTFQVVNNSIEILDLVTGVYALGPSDAMVFSVKIVT